MQISWLKINELGALITCGKSPFLYNLSMGMTLLYIHRFCPYSRPWDYIKMRVNRVPLECYLPQISQPGDLCWYEPQTLFKFYQLYLCECVRVSVCACVCMCAHECAWVCAWVCVREWVCVWVCVCFMCIASFAGYKTIMKNQRSRSKEVTESS